MLNFNFYSYLFLKIIGSLVDFEGEMEFRKNKVSGEGALYLLSFAQIRLRRGTSLVFDENVGRYDHWDIS